MTKLYRFTLAAVIATVFSCTPQIDLPDGPRDIEPENPQESTDTTSSPAAPEDPPTDSVWVEHNGDIPRLYLTVENTIVRENETTGTITIENPYFARGWKVEHFTSGIDIRARGNSSWTMFPKKSYKITLNQPAPLFNMPSEKEWCLIANYCDKTLLRNCVAYEASRIVGFDWTPGAIQVEVWLNDNYIGVYDLTENRKVSPNRVDIDVVSPIVTEGEGLEGDYYIEIGENRDEPVWFKSPIYGMSYEFKDPKHPNGQQVDYLKKYVEDFENALAGNDFCDPYKGYAPYIDIDSYIRYFIVEELAKDWDGDWRRSVFLTKEKNGVMKVCHIWDFDLAFSNCFDGDLGDPLSYEGWYIRNFYHKTGGLNQGPMYRMFQDPAFLNRAIEMWDEAYPELKKLPEYIDSLVEFMGPAVDRNFEAWPILGQYVWPNPVYWNMTYEDEVNRLKEWVAGRVEWINANIRK